jgi:hypothetical protein
VELWTDDVTASVQFYEQVLYRYPKYSRFHTRFKEISFIQHQCKIAILLPELKPVESVIAPRNSPGQLPMD